MKCWFPASRCDLVRIGFAVLQQQITQPHWLHQAKVDFCHAKSDVVRHLCSISVAVTEEHSKILLCQTEHDMSFLLRDH